MGARDWSITRGLAALALAALVLTYGCTELPEDAEWRASVARLAPLRLAYPKLGPALAAEVERARAVRKRAGQAPDRKERRKLLREANELLAGSAAGTLLRIHESLQKSQALYAALDPKAIQEPVLREQVQTELEKARAGLNTVNVRLNPAEPPASPDDLVLLLSEVETAAREIEGSLERWSKTVRALPPAPGVSD